jgi:ribonuclease-3
MNDWHDLDTVESALGFRFADRRLLRSALTHRSHLNEIVDEGHEDNERLEFLGDALLDFVAGVYLYRELPDAREGELTAIRAALVCEPALARYARSLDLGRHILLGRGEESSGGRDRSALLCDAFEAMVGALYLDQGLETASELLMRFLEPELEDVLREQRVKDAKSRFQEVIQHQLQITPHYVTIGESGPDHAKTFVVEVYVGDEAWGSGSGPSKARAARQAAIAALARLSAEDEASGGEALGVTGPPDAGNG